MKFKLVLVSTLCESYLVPMAYETCCLKFNPSNDILNKPQRCLQDGQTTWCKDKVGELFGHDLHPHSNFVNKEEMLVSQSLAQKFCSNIVKTKEL